MGADTRDAELVRKYLDSREPKFFNELVVRHRDQVVRMVFSVLGPELSNDAEDVVQESFLLAHDRLESFRGQSRFGTWLYRVAYNRALDHRRSAKRRGLREQRSQEGGAYPRTGAGAAGGAGAGGPAVERLLADERRHRVSAALDRVPQPYQAALRSYYWLDLSMSEIAEVLGVRPGTVKSYLYRGRARLADLLKVGVLEKGSNGSRESKGGEVE